ncbi:MULTISPECIES: N-acetyltransferase [Bradyrhizobium]|nr:MULTISPECIES: GNAT family N-acetyltransferase [Bradyrhizobium]UWU93608.1 GNAT family N-acetyltransferase [Bradyrhizobium sp. CB1015]
MAEHHPHEPHWYLPLIPVGPNWVGKGLGTLLTKYALQRCDEDGIAANLESSNPENIPFYQRHGFKVVGEIQHGSSPPLTPMLRTASFRHSKATPPYRLRHPDSSIAPPHPVRIDWQ